MNNVLVSIIIPSHNKANFINAAIDSAIQQTFKNVEIIIVDDSSTDSTKKILNSIENEKVKIFYKSFNNASATRNFGLANANGTFIQFLDADDILHPDKIKLQLQDMAFNEEVIGVCNTQVFYEHIEEACSELDSDFLRFSSDPKSFILNLYKSVDSGMVQPNAWLTPINVIKRSGVWNETLSVDDDGDFFCRVILESKAIIHTDKCLNYYRKFFGLVNNLSAIKTENAFDSMYKSAVLKKEYLKKKIEEGEPLLQVAINSLFVNVMVSAYPQFKIISSKAENNVDYNFDVVLPKIGGAVIEYLKSFLGWKIAKKIKYFVKGN